jgi:atypical dual specificity phosphatase
VDWITEQVAIGDYREAQDAEFLRLGGFGSVLGLIGTLSGKSPESLGVRRLEVVTLLDGPGNEPARFRRAVEALARLAAEAPPVLVHCRAGWSRSPAVVAAYLMRQRGLSAEQALAEVAAKRPGSMVPELRALLAEFEGAGA